MINEENRKTFVIRSKVINYVRRYLNERGFLEVRASFVIQPVRAIFNNVWV